MTTRIKAAKGQEVISCKVAASEYTTAALRVAHVLSAKFKFKPQPQQKLVLKKRSETWIGCRLDLEN